MPGEQNAPASNNFFLSVALCIAIAICLGLAPATVLYFRRAVDAEKAAELAVKQERVAEEEMLWADQRAAAAEKARDQSTYQFAYLKHVIGVEPLSEAELAVVRPSLSKDPVMQKLEELIAADRAKVSESFDPAGLVRDDYHTTLNMSCNVIRAIKERLAQLEEQNSTLITQRDEALHELGKLGE